MLRSARMVSQSRLQKDLAMFGSLTCQTPLTEEGRGPSCSIFYECAIKTEATFLKTLWVNRHEAASR